VTGRERYRRTRQQKATRASACGGPLAGSRSGGARIFTVTDVPGLLRHRCLRPYLAATAFGSVLVAFAVNRRLRSKARSGRWAVAREIYRGGLRRGWMSTGASAQSVHPHRGGYDGARARGSSMDSLAVWATGSAVRCWSGGLRRLSARRIRRLPTRPNFAEQPWPDELILVVPPRFVRPVGCPIRSRPRGS
jgi:hypothetical protein